MSTVAEIEAAIEHLPASELRRLREKLFSRSAAAPIVKPKKGAELAVILPDRFHLRPAEADALAAEMGQLHQERNLCSLQSQFESALRLEATKMSRLRRCGLRFIHFTLIQNQPN